MTYSYILLGMIYACVIQTITIQAITQEITKEVATTRTLSLEIQLIQSVQKNNITCVAELLESNVNVNWQDHLGNTALHYAALNNALQIMQLLLAQPDIMVNIQNNNLEAPLHWSSRGLPECIEALIEKGADIDLLDITGNIPEEYTTYFPSKFIFEQIRKQRAS